jgi:hypothetical protein
VTLSGTGSVCFPQALRLPDSWNGSYGFVQAILQAYTNDPTNPYTIYACAPLQFLTGNNGETPASPNDCFNSSSVSFVGNVDSSVSLTSTSESSTPTDLWGFSCNATGRAGLFSYDSLSSIYCSTATSTGSISSLATTTSSSSVSATTSASTASVASSSAGIGQFAVAALTILMAMVSLLMP